MQHQSPSHFIPRRCHPLAARRRRSSRRRLRLVLSLLAPAAKVLPALSTWPTPTLLSILSSLLMPRFAPGFLSAVAGIPLPDLLPKDKIDAIVERTRKGGAEIVNLLKTGSAYYAPSAAVVQMVEAILKDKRKILPCAAYLEGEYGINGLFVGVPCKLGAAGILEVIQIKLTAEENAALQKSSAAVRELVGVLGL